MRGRPEVSTGDPGVGGLDVGGLAAEIERRLREAGTPARAAAEKAYLKSSREFAGTSLPQTRRIVSEVTRGHSLPREDVLGLAGALWNRGMHECRGAGLILLVSHADDLLARDAALVERLIRASGTWALVDDLAGRVMGRLVERYSELGPPSTAGHRTRTSGSAGRRCSPCWDRCAGARVTSTASGGTRIRCWPSGSSSSARRSAGCCGTPAAAARTWSPAGLPLVPRGRLG
jgi:DNA alkylation repair enzyme